MSTIQKLLDLLAGNDIYNSLVDVMVNDIEGFAEAKQQYENAMCRLEAETNDNASPSVEDARDAIKQQTISNLLFSGALGMKANLDNFINPLTRNFLDVDSEVYLREETAHRLPEYESAQTVLERFYTILTSDQQTAYENVISYICHLETIAPKLAHYYGFLLGNEVFPLIIPGYHADMLLTLQYRMMLRNSIGRNISLNYINCY